MVPLKLSIITILTKNAIGANNSLKGVFENSGKEKNSITIVITLAACNPIYAIITSAIYFKFNSSKKTFDDAW